MRVPEAIPKEDILHRYTQYLEGRGAKTPSSTETRQVLTFVNETDTRQQRVQWLPWGIGAETPT